jgi:hypothetical protein
MGPPYPPLWQGLLMFLILGVVAWLFYVLLPIRREAADRVRHTRETPRWDREQWALFWIATLALVFGCSGIPIFTWLITR